MSAKRFEDWSVWSTTEEKSKGFSFFCVYIAGPVGSEPGFFQLPNNQAVDKALVPSLP
jgi:hypothetical protein